MDDTVLERASAPPTETTVMQEVVYSMHLFSSLFLFLLYYFLSLNHFKYFILRAKEKRKTITKQTKSGVTLTKLLKNVFPILKIVKVTVMYFLLKLLWSLKGSESNPC